VLAFRHHQSVLVEAGGFQVEYGAAGQNDVPGQPEKASHQA